MNLRRACELCTSDGGLVVHRGSRCRVLRVSDDDFPAFYRVVWTEHVAEFGDLSAADRVACIDRVVAVEKTLRVELAPQKINLASLGNVVPHLHWHVVARFAWDSRFPAPIWAPPGREADAGALRRLAGRMTEVDARVADAVSRLGA